MSIRSVSSSAPFECPATVATEATSVAGGDMPPNSTIAAIAESRGVSAEIGLCILDNANNKCTIMQFSDSSAYVRTVYHLHLFSVSILLLRAGVILPSQMPKGTAPFAQTNIQVAKNASDGEGHKLGTQSRLVANVSQMLPDIRIRTCPRAAFSDTASIEVLDHLCLPGTNSMVKQLLRSKWYALSAVAAVFHFLENDTAPAVTFPPQSIDFIVESCEGVAFIDSKSVSNLQLVPQSAKPSPIANPNSIADDIDHAAGNDADLDEPMKSRKLNRRNQQRQLYHKRGPSATLFDTINYTQTPMGARLLKVSILQPLASVSAISQRLDVVEWLVSHPQIHNRIQRILCRYSSTRDMDALITQVLKCDLHRNKDPVKRAHSVIRGAIDLYQSILGFGEICDMIQPAAISNNNNNNNNNSSSSSSRSRSGFNSSTVIDEDNTDENGDVGGGGNDDMVPELLAAIHAGLSSDGIQRTMAVLNKVIAPEAISTLSGRHSILFATKSGANGLLDAARTVYKELVDDVYALFDKYQDSYPELCLRLTYTAARGFGVELCSENGTFPTLPAVFIRARASVGVHTFITASISSAASDTNDLVSMVSGQANSLGSAGRPSSRCRSQRAPFIEETKKKKGSKKLLLTTLDLVKLNERLSRAMAEIEVLSGVVFEECVQFIHANASDLYRASESLALLDMLAGFASYCRQFDTTRPDFAVALAIQQGYHPILLDNSKRTAHCKDGSMATSEHTPVIANDVYACHGRNLQMITGANMAGKTTYICQVALLSIMAQVGVPVPAMAASFPVFDRFLARLSHEDSLKLNTSTFMVEIIDTLYILRNSHDSSRSAGCGDVSALVLIDELGRGTAPTDGRALAFTACERLAQLPVFAFVTTHFADVALALERGLPNAVILTVQSKLGSDTNDHAPASHINDDDDDGDDDGVDDFEEHRLSEGLLNVNSHYGIRLAQQLGLPDSVISRALSVARAFDNIDDGGGSATATATTTTDLHSPIFDGAENTNEEKFIHVRNAERLIHLACAAVDPKIAIAGAAALGTATAPQEPSLACFNGV